MYAVISDRTRQIGVRVGDVVALDHQDAQAGQELVFDQVLLLANEGDVRLGAPTIAGAQVKAEVLGAFRGRKEVVYRFKRRKNVRVKKGHRQDYLRVKITAIQG